MKKLFILMITIMCIFSFTSCGLKAAMDKKGEDEQNTKSTADFGKKDSNDKDSNKKEKMLPKVYAGQYHSLGIKADGSLWAWGSNVYGQLGTGKVTTYKEENVIAENNDELKPVQVMADIICAAAGMEHSLAVTKQHELYGWGSNGSSQLGLEGIKLATTPTKIMEDIIYVEVGDYNSAVIKEDNSLWVFGRNFSELNQSYSEAIDFTAKPTKVMDNIKDVSVSPFYTMALTQDGKLYMWGNIQYLGKEYSEDVNTEVNEPVLVMENVADISGNAQTPMAVTTEGDLYTWAFNGETGTLGSGTDEVYLATPQFVMGDVLKAVSCMNVNMAIKKDNSLWAWGGEDVIADFFSEMGYIGGSSLVDTLLQYGNKPVKIMEDVLWANGDLQLFAIDKDHQLWGWGKNQNGLLGLGTETTYDYNVIEDGEYSFHDYFIVENNDPTEPVKVMNMNQ